MSARKTTPTAARPKRYVVRLPMLASDLAHAMDLVRSLRLPPEADTGQTTVSEEDNPLARHWIFCDRRPCTKPGYHDGECAP